MYGNGLISFCILKHFADSQLTCAQLPLAGMVKVDSLLAGTATKVVLVPMAITSKDTKTSSTMASAVTLAAKMVLVVVLVIVAVRVSRHHTSSAPQFC